MHTCTGFKAAILQVLRHAMLAVDHFHVVQLANWAVTEFHRASASPSAGGAADGRDPACRIWNRLPPSAGRISRERTSNPL
ncbi:transposase [Paractinoplanes rhizophilus]|uniref:Transposase n=1 Tax=Paractinoplanes rhizophilus TaxID=1416877 RepID=A0ABW2HYW5_9ACTN